MPSSRNSAFALAKLLKDNDDFTVLADGAKSTLTVRLKYYQGGPVIDHLERVEPPRPARVRQEGRAAEGPRRARHRRDLDQPGRDDRP